jgi:hypothetical protein
VTVPSFGIPALAWTSLRVTFRGRLEFEFGRKRCAYEPQKESYSSARISARVEGVKTYLREPGMVSSAKRSRASGLGPVPRSPRDCIEPSNLDGRNEENDDISGDVPGSLSNYPLQMYALLRNAGSR